MKKIYRDVLSLSSVYAIGSIAQNALSVILIPLYTSYLSTGDFGILALMNLTISLLNSLIFAPISRACSRFYFKPDYQDKNGILLFNLAGLMIIQTLVMAVAYWFLSEWICGLIFDSQDLVHIVRLYTVMLILTSGSSFLLYFIRLLKMARYYVFLSLSNFLLSFFVIVYLLIWLKLGILAVIYGNILGLFYMTLMGIPFVWKHSTFRFSLTIMKEPLKYGYPLVVAGFSNLLIQSGDRYVLKIFRSLSDVGLYSFGYQIAALLNIVLVSPIRDGLKPVVLQKEKQPEEQKRFLINSATYYYWIGLFIALGLSLFAKEAIMILARKQEFWSSWVIVPIISFSYVQHGLGNFLEWGPIMAQKPYHISGSLLASAAVNIGLNFVFIPYWGLLGAAFATLISYVFWNVLRAYYSAKFYSLYFDIYRLLITTSVGVSMYLLSLTFVGIDSLLLTIPLKILILPGYILVFFLLPFFTIQEKNYMKELWQNVRTHGIKAAYGRLKAM